MKVRLEAAPVRGFRFAGVCAGLRNEPGRKDLGLIAADWPVAVAGVFSRSDGSKLTVVTLPAGPTWGTAVAPTFTFSASGFPALSIGAVTPVGTVYDCPAES